MLWAPQREFHSPLLLWCCMVMVVDGVKKINTFMIWVDRSCRRKDFRCRWQYIFSHNQSNELLLLQIAWWHCSKKFKNCLIKQRESIKRRLPPVEHNKRELYEWGELFQSSFWGSEEGGGWRGSHSRVRIRLPTEISWQKWGSEKNKQAS